MLGSHRFQTKNACIYKEITNIPLLIKARGGTEKNKRVVVDYPASHIDVSPTILGYFGCEVPALMEGKSMLSQIEDPRVRINDLKNDPDALIKHMDETRDLCRGYQWGARPWRKDKSPPWQDSGNGTMILAFL